MVRTISALLTLAFIGLALWSPALARVQQIARHRLFPEVSLVAHMALFAGLAMVFWWAWGQRAPWRVALALLALAIGLELGQGVVPGRAVELRDLLANGAGLALGLGLSLVVMWWRRL